MFKFVAGLDCDFHAGLPGRGGNLIVPYDSASGRQKGVEQFVEQNVANHANEATSLPTIADVSD